MKESNLCPFCGKEIEMQDMEQMPCPVCRNCGCIFEFYKEDYTEKEVEKLFNRRYTEEILQAQIKELKNKNKIMKKALRKIVRGEAGSSEPPSEMEGCMTSMSCFQCEEFQDIAQEALKGI